MAHFDVLHLLGEYIAILAVLCLFVDIVWSLWLCTCLRVALHFRHQKHLFVTGGVLLSEQVIRRVSRDLGPLCEQIIRDVGIPLVGLGLHGRNITRLGEDRSISAVHDRLILIAADQYGLIGRILRREYAYVTRFAEGRGVSGAAKQDCLVAGHH